MVPRRATANPRRVRIPLRWKLLGATIVVGAVAVAIAVSGLRRMQALNERMNQIVDVAAEEVKLASLLRQELIAVARAEKNLLLARTVDDMDRQASAIDARLSEMRTIQNRLYEVNPEKKLKLDAFEAKWSEWQKNHRDVRSFTRLNAEVRARGLSLGAAAVAFDQVESQLQTLADNLNADLTTAIDDALPRRLSQSAAKLKLVMHLMERLAALHRTEKNLILASTEESMTFYDEQFDLIDTSIRNAIAELHGLVEVEEEEQLLMVTDQAFQDYWDKVAEIRTILRDKSNLLVAHLAYEIGEPLGNEAEAILDGIIATSEARMRQLQAASSRQYLQSRNGLLLFSMLGIVLSVALSFYAGQRIARNLATLANYARDIQDARDLSKPVPHVSNDEVGMVAEALEQMRKTVYQRTRELGLLNETLERKNDEMEQFVYTVSHDLKSPLVSCKGLLGLMLEDIADANYAEVLDSAKRLEVATDQLSQIIDDLLELSRIGRKSLERSEIDMANLLDDLLSRLADRAVAAGVTMTIRRPIPNLEADVRDVQRAFENLLTNAIKYASDVPQPVVEVGGHVDEKQTLYFVRDNGPGIEPEYHEKIFLLFQRLDTSKEGTGLGLASVSKIMRMHGGHAWVESAPGTGATFWLAFPRHDSSRIIPERAT